MYTYTDEFLEQRSLRELKAIAYDCQIVPVGDKRFCQTWIDALVGVFPPLLQLLEVSSGVDRVQEVAVQPQESIESKFGRIVYPKLTAELIGKNLPLSEAAPSAIEVQHHSPLTFSPKFLATYSPYFGEARYKADYTGQLNLLEPETEDEPPDPDDFASIDDFQEAIAFWDFYHPEPIPGFDEWQFFEPATILADIDVWCDRLIELRLCGEESNRCPCGAMPAVQCDGTTATHIYPDRIIFTPCYKNLDCVNTQLVLCDRVGGRSPPGGDVYI